MKVKILPSARSGYSRAKVRLIKHGKVDGMFLPQLQEKNLATMKIALLAEQERKAWQRTHEKESLAYSKK